MTETILTIILAVLGLVESIVKAYPSIAQTIHDIVDGKVTAANVRVEDLLPAQSASRQAQKDLGG